MTNKKKARDKGANFLMVAASLVLVVAGMKAMKTIALPLLLAVFLSILSAPLLGWLCRHRVPKVVAVVTTVLANIMIMAVFLLLVGGSISAFTESVPRYQQSIAAKSEDVLKQLGQWVPIDTSKLAWLQESSEALTHPADGDLADPPSLLPQDTVDEPRDPAPQEAGLGVDSIFGLDAILDLIGATLRGIASASGFPHRLRLAFGWSGSDLVRFTTEIQRYLLIKTLICLMTGLLVGLALWVLRVEYPLLWGLIAFLFNYIPSIGSMLAAIPPVVLSWIDVSLTQAVLVGLVFVVVNVTLGNFLEPHLMGRRFGMSTLVVVLSLIFWGWLWGPVGMLLSVPLTMIVKIAMENTEDFRWVAQLISTGPRETQRETPELDDPSLVSSTEG
jgi:predicted PurR-regulated permease PerM